MDVKDFDYDLPEELIAQDPLSDRSASRLMVLDTDTGEVTHRHFKDILEYLHEGDCLVINDTKVIPARLLGVKEETGAHVELLLLKRLGDDCWECLVRPGKKLRKGARVSFGDGVLKAEIRDTGDEGSRIVKFYYEGIFEEVLDRLGEMPLPPYITHKLKDKNRYQTVYAKHEGSAAAPTAGLHFTEELLCEIEKKGVDIARICLHVGLGTFRPVKADKIEDHHMHSEFYIVDREAAEKINRARERGKRVIAVGTTSMRTLESAAVLNTEYKKLAEDGLISDCNLKDNSVSESGAVMTNTEAGGVGFGDQYAKSAVTTEGRVVSKYVIKSGSGNTEIFIYPGYEFKLVDALITNFHLPQSTLIMLVSALAGRDHVLSAYEEAVKERYRFFSFGDAMFIYRKKDDPAAENGDII